MNPFKSSWQVNAHKNKKTEMNLKVLLHLLGAAGLLKFEVLNTSSIIEFKNLLLKYYSLMKPKFSGRFFHIYENVLSIKS